MLSTHFYLPLLTLRLIDPQNPQPCLAFFMHNNLSGATIMAMPNLTEVSNLLFRCGNADILHHRILRLFLTLVPGGLPCEHPFIEAAAIGGAGSGNGGDERRYHCLDCKCHVTDPLKIQREREKRDSFLQQQYMRQQMQLQRQRQRHEGTGQMRMGEEELAPLEQQQVAPVGVSVAWLAHWTQEHNCWHMPTWLVRRLFVLPLTSQTNCCYADLPHMQMQAQTPSGGQSQGAQQAHHMPSEGASSSPGSEGASESKSRSPPTDPHSDCHSNAPTGPAHTYVAHKWGNIWGDLVRAVIQHSTETADWGLKVYLDVFCCSRHQFPSPSASSSSPSAPSTDPLVVMRQCQAFLLISPDPPSPALTQHLNLSTNQANKLASPHFWNFASPHTTKK